MSCVVSLGIYLFPKISNVYCHTVVLPPPPPHKVFFFFFLIFPFLINFWGFFFFFFFSPPPPQLYEQALADSLSALSIDPECHSSLAMVSSLAPQVGGQGSC